MFLPNIFNMDKKVSITIVVLSFIASLYYIINYIDTSLFYFVQQPAFLTSKAFFTGFLKFPGGISQYLSVFFEQFFINKITGAIILSLFAALTGMFLWLTLKNVFKKYISPHFSFLIVLGVYLIVWHDLKFTFSIIIQLLVTSVIIYFFSRFAKSKISTNIFTIVALAIVYYVLGPMFMYIFTVTAIIILFINQTKKQYWFYCLLIIIAAFIPFFYQKFVANVSVYQAWLALLPYTPFYLHYKISPLLYIVLFILPLLLVINLATYKSNITIKPLFKILFTAISSIVILCTTVYGINKYNNKTVRLRVKIAQCAYNKQWQNVLKLSEKGGEYDRMTNFYVNQALYHTSNMGTQLFNCWQPLGVDALFVEKPLNGDICMPTSYLYFDMGLISNALRFAYEAQTLTPQSPFVLKQIIDCLIIIGDTANANKFLNNLYLNPLYKKWVTDRRAYLKGKNSELTKQFVDQKKAFMPEFDFFMGNSANNALQLVEHNHNNKMANEYLLSYFMLSGKLNDFVKQLINTTSQQNVIIPKLYQEVVILYLGLSPKPFSQVFKFIIDDNIKQRFKYYNDILRKHTDINKARPELAKNFSDTYWYYIMFDSPMVTKASVNTREVVIEH